MEMVRRTARRSAFRLLRLPISSVPFLPWWLKRVCFALGAHYYYRGWYDGYGYGYGNDYFTVWDH